jgi:hypothetical protein
MVLVLGTGIMVAGTAVTSGLMTVSVQEGGPDGLDLYVPLPAGVVEGALAVAPIALRFADDHGADGELAELRAELVDVLPIAVALLDGIARMPDAVLVEVEDGGEYVRVSKAGSRLEIQVIDGDDRVTVGVPVSVLRSVGRFLEG